MESRHFATALVFLASKGFVDILYWVYRFQASSMAFCTKLGGHWKQGVNVPVSSMLGSLRYMSTKLYIGGKYNFLSDCFIFLLFAAVDVFFLLYSSLNVLVTFIILVPGLSPGTDEHSLKDSFSSFNGVTEGMPWILLSFFSLFYNRTWFCLC